MHDDLKWFKQKPIPKILQKPQQFFKKSQKYSKPPKVRSKDMKCMINEWENIIPEKKNDLEAEDLLGMRFGVRERWLGRWGDVFCWERSRRKGENITHTLFIGTPVSRWIERYRYLSRIKTREMAIEDLSRGFHSKRGSMDWEAIEHPESSSMDRVAVEKLSRMR